MAEAKGYDWPILFKEFKSSNLTQRQWCADRSMNETDTARHFAELRRQEADRFKERALLILAGAAPLAARTAKSLITSDDENVQLKASFGVLGAIGISPQVAAIQVNTKIETNILAVPIFASQASPLMDKFLGSVDADTTPDS